MALSTLLKSCGRSGADCRFRQNSERRGPYGRRFLGNIFIAAEGAG